MKLRGKITKRCEKLIKLRFYPMARNLLVNYINNETGSRDINSEAYSLLSQIDLVQGDIPKAEHHISRALLADRSNVIALMSKAYVYIAEKNYEEALRTYFTVLSIEPANKLAKININRIKTLSKFKKRPAARKYLVYSSLPTTAKFGILACFLAFVVVMSYLSVNIFYPMIELRFFDLEQRQLRERLNNFYLFDGLEELEAEGSQSITYTPKQIADMFALAKDNMIKGDINSAVTVINTARGSDINIYLKEQFERLSSFIIAPNYNALKNNISYTALIENPALYIGGFVKWTGRLDSFERVKNENGDEEKLARIVVVSNSSSSLMSGEEVSEGIAIVIFDIDTELTKNEKLEVYGRIESFNSQRKIPTIRSLVVKHLPQNKPLG